MCKSSAWQTVRRISNEILGVKGLRVPDKSLMAGASKYPSKMVIFYDLQLCCIWHTRIKKYDDQNLIKMHLN